MPVRRPIELISSLPGVVSHAFYAWIGLRLAHGTAGIPTLQAELAGLARKLQHEEVRSGFQNLPGITFSVNRPDVIHHQVQQSIRPEAIALSIFGAIAALAMLVLAGQGLAQMISRSAPDMAVISSLGGSRTQAALAASMPGVLAVLGGASLAVAGAVALSPLAPVGPVRRFDPARGFHIDVLALGAGSAILALTLIVLLAALTARWARRRVGGAPARRSAIAALTAATAGLRHPPCSAAATPCSQTRARGRCPSGQRCSDRSPPSPQWSWPSCSAPA
jgi:hypothetical protein